MLLFLVDFRISLCVCGLRIGNEVHQQQTEQPFVYVPASQMYDDRPPAPVVDRSSDGMLPVTAASTVPANEQYQHLQRWETGPVMPAPLMTSSALPKSEMVQSAGATYPPYQISSAEQKSGILPSYAAASQSEEWRQYGVAYNPAYGQMANSDMQRQSVTMPEYHPEFYDNRQNVNVGQSVGENEPRLAGLEVNTSSVRAVSSSALRQPASAPGTGKKTVTFHENIATEYAIRQSYGSTSSESSFMALPSPPDMSGGYDSVAYQGTANSYYSPAPR